MQRFDWFYLILVTWYKYSMLDRPDPFIFQEVHKRVGCTGLIETFLALLDIKPFGRVYVHCFWLASHFFYTQGVFV